MKASGGAVGPAGQGRRQEPRRHGTALRRGMRPLGRDLANELWEVSLHGLRGAALGVFDRAGCRLGRWQPGTSTAFGAPIS